MKAKIILRLDEAWRVEWSDETGFGILRIDFFDGEIKIDSELIGIDKFIQIIRAI